MTTTTQLSPEKEQLFAEKARSYVVCYSNRCPLREHCLRSILLRYVPADQYITTSINLNHPQMQQKGCPRYASDQPLRMPYGLSVMYSDMPGRLERTIKNHLISKYSRKRYYEYHNGVRSLTPDVEQYVRQTLQHFGWQHPPQFIGYREEYQW